MHNKMQRLKESATSMPSFLSVYSKLILHIAPDPSGQNKPPFFLKPVRTRRANGHYSRVRCAASLGIAVAQSQPGCSVPALGNSPPSRGVSSHFGARVHKDIPVTLLIGLLFSCSHLPAECAAVSLTSSVLAQGQPHSEGQKRTRTSQLLWPGAQHAHSVVAPTAAPVSAEDLVAFAGHSSEAGTKRNPFDASLSFLVHPKPCQMSP